MNLSNLSNPKFIERVTELWTEARDASAKWRKAALDDFRFDSGDQWSKDDLEFLKENRRPVVTFNRTKPFIDGVVGAELANRQAVTFLPMTLDDGGLAEIFTETSRWVRHKADVDDEETHAFRDCAVCGVGTTEWWVDFEAEIDGQIKKDRFSPLEAYWDPHARKQNFSDARWVGRVKRIPREVLKDMFPNKRLFLQGGFNDADSMTEHRTISGDQYQSGETLEETIEGLPVFQFQWWERVPIFRALNPETGQIEIIEEHNAPILEAAGFQVVRQAKREYWQALIVGRTVLTKTPLHKNFQGKSCPGFTIKFITAYWDEDKKQPFGMMRSMRDPQQWANKFFSQVHDILNSQAKGGIMAERDAFADQRKAEEDWAKPDRIVWVEDGALSGQKPRVQDRPAGQFPAGFDRLMSVAIDALHAVTGVNIEYLGMAERTQAGVVERQRIAQGMVILAWLFNALRRYRKEDGRVLLHMMRMYIPDKKMIRVTGRQPFPFQDNPDVVDFDILVDQSPTSPNFKQEAWLAIREILPVMMKAGYPVPPEVIQFLPIPDSVAQKFIEFYKSQGPSEEEKRVQEMVKQLQVAGLEADVALKRAQAMNNILKSQAAIGGVQAKVKNDLMTFFLKAERNMIEEQKAQNASHAQISGKIMDAATKIATERMKTNGRSDTNRSS